MIPEGPWSWWEERRFVRDASDRLTPEGLQELLRDLHTSHPELQLERVGASTLGRPISMLSVGQGPQQILLWSQMHGDEPSATPALLDLAHWLVRSSSEVARTVLDRLSLRIVPMLNPDGAHAFTRENAQGIDINRDARTRATPEG